MNDVISLVTCLHRPGLPVYPGLVYLFTQAWSTCLPRPGLRVYPGLVYLFTQAWIFRDMETPSKTYICHGFRDLWGLQGSRLLSWDPPWKVSMTPSIFSQIHNMATSKVMFELLGPWKWALFRKCSFFTLCTSFEYVCIHVDGSITVGGS